MSAPDPTVPDPALTQPAAAPPPASHVPGVPPTLPVPPAPPAPQKWAARVVVPGAHGPGQSAPVGSRGPAYSAAGEVLVPVAPARRRHRRRVLTALLALVLIVAVPIVSAYVSYKLASGENPFEWPPTVDYQKIFGS